MGWHPHPTEVRWLEDEHVLRITFSDDLQHDYRTEILRGYCPCARCQGHGSMPLKWQGIGDASQLAIDDISQVGNYGFCIAWSDGHNTGVYSWEFLRQIIEEPDKIFERWPVELEEPG